jgi:hypothetical protein
LLSQRTAAINFNLTHKPPGGEVSAFSISRVVGRFIICLSPLFLEGCLPSVSDGPTRLIPVDVETAELRQQFGNTDFNAYMSMSEGQRVAYRNNLVTARMYAMDLQYSEFEAALTRERQEVNFAADVVNIGLTSSAALVAAQQAKTVLAAVASGLTGVKSSYNDDILLNKTIQILQNQMRANRAQVAARIFLHLKASSSAYPLPVALSELEDYYRAGTVTGALVQVSASVAIDETRSNQEKNVALSQLATINSARDRLPAVVAGRNFPGALNSFEASLTADKVIQIQRAFCVRPATGTLDNKTREQIARFFVGYGKPRTNILTAGIRRSDMGPITKGINEVIARSPTGDCFAAGLTNAQQIGRLAR